MLIVRDLFGEEWPVYDYDPPTISQERNGKYYLDFTIHYTERNKEAFDAVENEHFLIYDGQTFRIKDMDDVTEFSFTKEGTADHIFFDIGHKRRYDSITGSRSINQIMLYIFNGTGYTFSISGSFANQQFENFGNGADLVELFTTALSKFKAEYKVVGNTVFIAANIGRATNIQIRHGYNMKKLNVSTASDGLATYIKAYGKQNENGSYQAQVEYTSPNAAVYGVREAPPIKDDRFTNNTALLEYAQEVLSGLDHIPAEFEVTRSNMREMNAATGTNINYDEIELGDELYVIVDKRGIVVPARVVKISKRPESPDNDSLTIGTKQSNIVDIQTSFGKTSKTVERVFNEGGTLNSSVIPSDVTAAAQAVLNSMQELQYPDSGGLQATDPTDTDNIMRFIGKGIEFSRDSGNNWLDAITAEDGVTADRFRPGAIIDVSTDARIGCVFELGQPSQNADPKVIIMNGVSGAEIGYMPAFEQIYFSALNNVDFYSNFMDFYGTPRSQVNEGGRCGVGAFDPIGTTSTIAAVYVQFKMKRPAAPGNIVLTSTDSNTTATASDLTADGFWLSIVGDGTPDIYKYWRGTYQTQT